MKDTKAWSQKIQEDKNFAKGYKGLTSVKDILKKAKADGYNLKESDITKEDIKALEAVAGGNGMPGMGALQGMSGGNDGNGGNSIMGPGANVHVNPKVVVVKAGQNISATEGSTVGNESSFNFNVSQQ